MAKPNLMQFVTGEEFSEYDLKQIPDDVRFVAYWYQDGDYDGRGYALAGYDDGKYAIADLGHCSCYGPTQNFPTKGDMAFEEVMALIGKNLRGKDIVPSEWDDEALKGLWEAVHRAINQCWLKPGERSR